MSENVKAFMEKIKADKNLMEKAKEIEEKYPQMTSEKKAAIISFAKELDMTIVEDDFDADNQGELTDDALAAVSGGFFITLPWWK